jgi:hypothetical protein
LGVIASWAEQCDREDERDETHCLVITVFEFRMVPWLPIVDAP